MSEPTRLILLVHAVASTRSTLSQLLARHGYAVAEASDAQTAREFLNRRLPDLLLTDAALPDDDGIAYWSSGEYESLPHKLPVVVLAPPHNRDYIRRALAAGASDVLVRPADLVITANAIRSALGGLLEIGDEATDRRLYFRQRMLVPIQAIPGGWVIDVSERGIGVELPEPLPLGASVVLELGFWEEIGIEPPLGRIVYCATVGRGATPRYRAGVLLVGLDASTLRRLRKWLLDNQIGRAYRPS